MPLFYVYPESDAKRTEAKPKPARSLIRFREQIWTIIATANEQGPDKGY